MAAPPTLDEPLSSAPDAAASLPTPAPEAIAGRYEIVGLLGVGGMGSVYRARDRQLDEVVALKVLRKDLAGTPGAIDRFRREVKLARRVTHRNVARVYDIGEHAGDVFLTMEYIDGEALAALAARGPMEIGRAVEIASAISAGLAAAHAAGVIHRDLKPDNVMVAKDGRILVTDFGIARAASGDAAGPSATIGMIVGTPTYMAPEQLEGASDVDVRADVYAFGAMLFELLCGAPAWTGASPLAVASARLFNPPPDPRGLRPDLPDALARMVQKCMARNRADRYASVEQLAAELSGITLPAVQASPQEKSPSVRPGPPEQTAEKSIAVLPFRNAGPAGDEYLADGLTDDLIDALSMTRGLRVRSRRSVMALKGIDEDPRELGRKLNVQVVVDGSVRKIGTALRINARLISVADGFQLWARRFDRSEADVLAVNDETSRAIAEALTVDLAEARREAPTDPMAIDLYLRARQLFRKLDPASVAASVVEFEKALALSPDNATILSGYAVALGRHWFYAGGAAGANAGNQARQAAEKAIRAAPHMGEPRLALAWVLLHGSDAAGAVRELKAAIARAPALAEAHEMLARVLSEVGLADEARRGFEKALSLDPYLHFSHLEVARAHAFAGQWDDVHAAIDRVTDGSKMVGPFYRLRMALWQGDEALVARMQHEVLSDTGDAPIGLFARLSASRAMSDDGLRALETAGAQGGRRYKVYWGQLTAELGMTAGRDDVALACIGRAVDEGLIDLAWMDHCPLLSKIRASPEFQRLRERVKERADAVIRAYSAP